MAERRDVPRGTIAGVDALLEAFIELARAAIAAELEVEERRRTMTVVDGGKRGGKAA